jgi:peptide/nickel transport system permease protein
VTRLVLRRLAIIPIVLLLVNLLGFAYAHIFLPVRASRIPYLAAQSGHEPLPQAYAAYLQSALRLEFGTIPGEEETIASAIAGASVTSLGLVAVALTLSVAAGLTLGLRAVRSEEKATSRWLTFLSTLGLSMPSFYIGSLLITAVFFYALTRNTGTPFPMQGFGWDEHLVLPTLALMARPTVQIAQMTAGLVERELGKRYVLTARSIGQSWSTIRRRHVLRNVLAPVVLTVAGSARLLLGELILVEWLFNWPGLGQLFALALVPGRTSRSMGSPLFLNPPVVATVLTVFAALFLVMDLVSDILVQVFDPRQRATEEEGTGSADTMALSSKPGRRNWALILGGAIVFLTIVLSIVGPDLARWDPLEEHTIIRVDDGWEVAPFPAFTVPGFPLGSDSRGRDLMSRLLWAVRPTVILVTIVALVRLVLGTLVGLVAGWSSGWPGHLLDSVISGALSMPALMVALVTITAVGIEYGLAAFLIGLSANGWAETARMVRERTHLVRRQQYVEAARALGQSDLQIILGHVLRQVMPMVWMLLALEISGTLMSTAGLGFLGYFVGGDMWIEIEDYVARQFSGMPELGQMLATADLGVIRLGLGGIPWAMAAVGSAIFTIVLGFNMLGNGLRLRLSLDQARNHQRVSAATRHAGIWLEQKVFLPISDWARAHTVSTTLIGLLLLTLTVVLAWWQVQAAERPTEPGLELVIPGDHLWPMERHDAYGTLWTEATGPISPTIQWTFEDPERFSGGPVVAADGTVYIASEGGSLFALDTDGSVLWKAHLPAAGVGSPALDAEGKIYVADKAGGLSVFTSDGTLLWQFQPETENSIATTGPIVAPDGRIHYGVRACAQAVSPEGKALWRTCPPHDYRTMPLQVAPSEELLFWKQVPFSAQDGSLVNLETLANVDQYIVGGDGRTYLRDAAKVSLWRRNGSAIEILETTQWDTRMLGTLTQPSDAGVTYDQTVWLFYRFSGFIWLDTGGRVLGFTRVPLNRGRVIALDRDDTAYICGGQSFSGASQLSCLAVAPKREEPVWLMPLEIDGWVKGGALVPGRLYAVVEEQERGLLYAIGDDER